MRRLIWLIFMVVTAPCLLLGLMLSCLYRPQMVITDFNQFMAHWWHAWGHRPKWGQEK